MENKNLIKLFDCTQVAEGLPIYEGTCSICGEKVQVMETGLALEIGRQAHNLGLKKGIWVGIAATLLGVATTWTLNRLFSDKED